MVKIAVGCPVKDRGWVLETWFDAVETQIVPGIEIEVVCVYSESEDDTEKILRSRGAHILYDEKRGRSPWEINSHAWGSPAVYEYMASLRNQLLDWVQASDADFFLSLDSDILAPFGTLKALLDFYRSCPGVISPAVNMGLNGTVAWNTMRWVSGPNSPATRQGTPPDRWGKVDVVMAAMLLDRSAVETLRWAPHPQGEDLGFSANAARAQIPLYWLPQVACPHLMKKGTFNERALIRA